MTKAKRFLEHQIKQEMDFIKRQEREFDEFVSSNDRNYDAIIQCALSIKAQKDKLYGMKKALKSMDMCED